MYFRPTSSRLAHAASPPGGPRHAAFGGTRSSVLADLLVLSRRWRRRNRHVGRSRAVAARLHRPGHHGQGYGALPAARRLPAARVDAQCRGVRGAPGRGPRPGDHRLEPSRGGASVRPNVPDALHARGVQRGLLDGQRCARGRGPGQEPDRLCDPPPGGHALPGGRGAGTRGPFHRGARLGLQRWLRHEPRTGRTGAPSQCAASAARGPGLDRRQPPLLLAPVSPQVPRRRGR
eukprot:scaffold19191_cov134-Isochrysis_galbana.AAC.12